MLEGEKFTTPEILSSRPIKMVRLLDNIGMMYRRDFIKSDPMNPFQEFEDERSILEILKDPEISEKQILSPNIVAVKTFSLIEQKVKLGQEIVTVKSEIFNLSPLMFLGGERITYREALKYIKKTELDSQRYIIKLKAAEHRDNPGWRAFSESDPMIIASDGEVYSIRTEDIIIPGAKDVTKKIPVPVDMLRFSDS